MSYDVLSKLLAAADVQINGTRPWDMQVHNESTYARILKDGDLGAGESYMEGWWDCQQLGVMIEKVLRADVMSKVQLSLVDKAKAVWSMLTGSKSTGSSKEQLCYHYDIGNDLYKAMLDPYMQYTCGFWRNGATTLEQAQLDKLDMICKKVNARQGCKWLDLGCGFSGLMKYATEKYSTVCTGYNLSTDQMGYGRDVLCAGLPITFVEGDFCKTLASVKDGKFDVVTNVGSIEHCGVNRYREFMQNAYNCIADDGVFLTQSILSGSKDTQYSFLAFLNKYIFPGGVSPTLTQLSQAMEGLFVIEDVHNFGEDYAKTLAAWHANLTQAWASLSANNPKYTTKFKRMFDFYLLCCAGTFRARGLNLLQIVATKVGRTQPLCRYGGVNSSPYDTGVR
jgi:cyclopropane-fatty-acyl-phospholipid synthase